MKSKCNCKKRYEVSVWDIMALPPAVHSPAAFQLVPDYHLNKTTDDLATD